MASESRATRLAINVLAVALLIGVPLGLAWMWWEFAHDDLPRSEEEMRGVCDFSQPFKPVRWIDGMSRQKCTARKDGECFEGSRAGSAYYACPESDTMLEVVLPPGTWLVDGSGAFSNKCRAEWVKPGGLCTAEHRKREKEEHGK